MSLGINLRVTGHSNQGGRKYMEDYFSVAYQASEVEKNDVEYAYFGIFDGHGGSEAAKFAKDHLLREIVNNKLFWSKYDSDVLRAIREGYISTHYAMWREQEKWPKTATGLPSTAGTTASVAFIFRKKIYIGHVGDSGIILGYQEEGDKHWKAKPLTQDHKPECNVEKARIINSGGKVVTKSGVPRVVWNRPRIGHKGPVRRSTPFDEIPFLAVARSLGDLWSYNSALNQFIVSPDPDVRVVKIDSKTFRCLIFGTDGLWNVVSPNQAVDMARDAEIVNERLLFMSGKSSEWTNPSKYLVEKALERWSLRRMRADNTSVITVFLDQPGQLKKIDGITNNVMDNYNANARYEMKCGVEQRFTPTEHGIYNQFYGESMMRADGISNCLEENQDFYSEYNHHFYQNKIQKNNLVGSPEHINTNSCYSFNSLEYSSPSSNHFNSPHECTNSINGFTVVEHYNTNCDNNNYSFYENSLNSSDNSSSNYKYDVPQNNKIISNSITDESVYFSHDANNAESTHCSNITNLESSFNLTHQLNDSAINSSNAHSLDPLAIVTDLHETDVVIQNDGSTYSHSSFAESYNSLLISSLKNENSNSSSSSSSGSSSSSSSSRSRFSDCSSTSNTSKNGNDPIVEDDLCDGHLHSYKSLNETGLAGHDHVFQHSPNSSHEEQQEQYQKACMLREEGYSLTKLETRVEQRLRNTNVYPGKQQMSQPTENESSLEQLHSFKESVDIKINSYNQYNNITSSFTLDDNVKNSKIQNTDICDTEAIPFYKTNKTQLVETVVETSDNIQKCENSILEEMETEILDEELIDERLLLSNNDNDNILNNDNDAENTITNNCNEYIEESIQINEISSSNIEIASPMPSPSSSFPTTNFILEKLEIEPCLENDFHQEYEEPEIPFKINITRNNNTSSSNKQEVKNDIKTNLIKKCKTFPDKQNENENSEKQKNSYNFISKRCLRSFQNNNTRTRRTNVNSSSTNSINSRKNNINITSSSLSKDMKAKRSLKNKLTNINSNNSNLTKSIVAKEFLKLVNNSVTNNNIILTTKLRSRPNNINSSIRKSPIENIAPTQKVTVWGKRSRKTTSSTQPNNNNISIKVESNNKTNQKLGKALCANNTFKNSFCNTPISSNSNKSNNNIINNSKITTQFRLQNNSFQNINSKCPLPSSSVSSLCSTISSSLISSSSSSLQLSPKRGNLNSTTMSTIKRSSTSRNSASWCPNNKKSVQTRNRVQKR